MKNYYAADCELVIGLVCPVGVNLDDVHNRLTSMFEQFGYSTNYLHLSDIVQNHFGENPCPPKSSGELARLDAAMEWGTTLREKFQRGDLFALLAIDAINAKREEENNVKKPLKKTVHIIRSLKHVDEVETLRQIYGSGFFLLGISATIDNRKRFLENTKGIPLAEIERVISRDDKEKRKFGQQTRNVFQLADAFITTDDNTRLSTHISRILDLIFSKPVVPPTSEEYAMFMAYAASLRSADLSRQVGAVITNEHGDILSTGANDVPKYGGGLYWPGEDDKRDYILGHDRNESERRAIVDELVSIVKKSGGDDIEESLRENLRTSRVMDITEFGRCVHAEMEAILLAARNGVPLRGSRLYTTTYPCHNCAKHIVAAGIEEVIYVEPYPKSYAKALHDDSIATDSPTNGQKVNFRQFVGVGPRRFVDLFSMHLSSGRSLKRKKDGKLSEWNRAGGLLRVPMTPLSYIDAEMALVMELTTITEGESGNEPKRESRPSQTDS